MTIRTKSLCAALGMIMTAIATAQQEHQCLIEPYRKIEIRSPVEALIDSVLVERGSIVKKNQPLVQLHAKVEQAALASARYRATMEGAVKTSEARVTFAREKHRRRDELNRQNFTSTQDRDEALAELRVAEAELIEARDNRELSALEAKRLAEQLHLRTLQSPFDGVVTEVLQHPAELAQTGENARAILKLSQIHPLRIEVILPVRLHNSIWPGAIAEVESEAPSKAKYKATVQIVDKVVDSASGTFGVRLELPNPAGKILAGVKCKIRFQ